MLHANGLVICGLIIVLCNYTEPSRISCHMLFFCECACAAVFVFKVLATLNASVINLDSARGYGPRTASLLAKGEPEVDSGCTSCWGLVWTLVDCLVVGEG